MRIIEEPITGKEVVEQGTSFAALVEFYKAFNGRDLALMSQNWDQSEDIAMDNPLGGIKRGWEEIQSVYARLFNGPAKVYVEFYDYTLHEKGDTMVAIGRERGFFELKGTRVDLAIRTSRLFERNSGRWKQLHHHGSITDPELLGRYQHAVMNG